MHKQSSPENRLARAKVKLRNEQEGLRALAARAHKETTKNGYVGGTTQSQINAMKARIQGTKDRIAEMEAELS